MSPETIKSATGIDFGSLLSNAIASDRKTSIVESEFAKRLSTYVLVGYQRSKTLFGRPKRSDPWTIQHVPLFRLNAYDFHDLVADHAHTKTLDYAGQHDWKYVRIAKLDDETKTKLAELDAKIVALREERDAYLRVQLKELEPYTWDEFRDALKSERETLRDLKKSLGVS